MRATWGRRRFRFIEFLAAAGQKIWQVLPLNPTGYADSPYQCFSAFAGNPLLISLDLLAEQGWLKRDELADVPESATTSIDYGAVIDFRFAKLRKAAARFSAGGKSESKAEYESFCSEAGGVAGGLCAVHGGQGCAWRHRVDGVGAGAGGARAGGAGAVERAAGGGDCGLQVLAV